MGGESDIRRREGILSSLGARLSGSVLVITATIVILLLLSLLVRTYRVEGDRIDATADEIRRVHLPGLTAAIYDYTGTAQAEVDALADLRHVAWVRLETGDGSFDAGAPPRGEGIEEELALTHPEAGRLGTLRITFDRAGVWSEVAAQARSLLGLFLVPILIMALAIIIVFRRLVTRHLHELGEHVRGLGIETLDRAFRFRRRPPARPDELDLVLEGIDEMRANLREQVSQRRRAEEELDRTRQWYQEVFDSTGDAIFIHEATTGRVLAANRTAERLYQIDRHRLTELTAGDVSSGEPPYARADAARWIRRAVEDGPQVFEWRARRGDGSLFWVEVGLRRTLIAGEERVLAIVRDITARRETEAEIRQLQKMDSLGQLAGGVAHDFNNMLAGIIGAAELIGVSLPEADENHAHVRQVLQASEQAGALTSKLLAFSRRRARVSEIVEVNGVVHDALAIFERSVDRRIEIRCDLMPSRPEIRGDPVLIQNAVLNLCLNGRDAMPEGGRLDVSTSEVVLDDVRCATSRFDMVPGPYVRITVRDTGSGIPDEHLSRIFEPFFTTKEVGKGTGLGLAAAYGTMTQHRGGIEFESALGGGTTFHLLFPKGRHEAAGKPRAAEEVIRGEGRVLVVDDEDIVREIAQEMLRSLGYEVLVACDGEGGVAVFSEHHARIDLVLLDLVMPRVNGTECFRRLRAIDPEARVLLCSGFTRDTAVEDLRAEGIAGFLSKPYRLAALSTAVARALGSDPAESES